MESSYIKSALRAHDLPSFDVPEYAFVGRSNVGKSSLLNALLNRRGLARQSRTPGRTQMVNFFGVNDQTWIVADLPGYGYSSTGRLQRQYWPELLAAYFARPVARLLFLADCRRKPTAEDLDILEFLQAQPGELWLVVTKIDKLNQAEGAKATKQWLAVMDKVGIKPAAVHSVSATKRKGVQKMADDLFAKSE